jgi:exopolyphosphatase/guanosine-5'-triphosphate,3'-diphosphate pyrophosphatase
MTGGSPAAPAGAARRLATLDLGTNTVRLLVVDAVGPTWRPVSEAQRVTRLGEGQAGAGRLLDGPMRRTVDATAELAGQARRLGATAIRVVATSAVREAANRAEFVARVRAATGLEVLVVSGEDEGRLAVTGVAAGLPELGGTLVLFDIGGGSTEVARSEGGRCLSAVSLPLGVVALAERFGDRGRAEPGRLWAMRREVDRRLAGALPREISAPPRPPLVGTAGTVTTLAALDLGLARYDGGRVQGHRLGRPAVERLLLRLADLTAAEREALPCVEAGRGDLLVPGAAVCLAILDRLERESFLVSDRGLREGIVDHVLASAGPGPGGGEGRAANL